MKLKASVLLLGILLTISVSNSYAAPVENNNPTTEKVINLTDGQKARLEEISARVKEIKEMDKSSLSRAERKALKKELRSMNKESKEMKGGVYLSVGAIIIIILLLILIL